MSKNEIVPHVERPLVAAAAFDLSPRSFDEAMRMADRLSESTLVPKDFVGRPGNVFVAIQWGMELGLKPMQAMQNIAVINGRPSLWGDAVLALVLNSPLCEYVQEWEEGGTAYCKVKRVGKPEDIQTFGDKEAKQAGLSGKQGPWSQYPQRMKKMRARAFALRDNFADVLKGLPIAEEVMDTPTERGVAAAQVTSNQATVVEAPPELQQKARAASDQGVSAYQDFWKKATKEDRKALAQWHEGFKAAAVLVDEQQAAQQAAPASEQSVTPQSVAACLDAAYEARDIDELNTAADMIRSVSGDDHQQVLREQYQDLLQKIEGEQ